MTSFAYNVFNPADYASCRPTYPSLLYEFILNYHKDGERIDDSRLPSTALDLGCGTGQVTQVLPRLGFNTVIGADPSQKMIDQAYAELPQASVGRNNIKYIMGKAEDVDKLVSSESIGIITAGMAAHWFEHEKLWPALSKVLAPGGTIAFWGYTDFQLKDYPEITPTIRHFFNSPEQLGTYWEQPGRSISYNHMQTIAFPTSPEWDQTSARRIYFSGKRLQELDLPYEVLHDSDNLADAPLPSLRREYKTDIILRKTHTWESMKTHIRTRSALQHYYDRHPEEKENRGMGEDGDIVERFVSSLKEQIGGEEVTLEWPLTLLMIKKRRVEGQ